MAIAQGLPDDLAAAVVAAAQVAFIDAIHVIAVVSTVGAVLTAIGTATALRGVAARSEAGPERETAQPAAATD